MNELHVLAKTTQRSFRLASMGGRYVLVLSQDAGNLLPVPPVLNTPARGVVFYYSPYSQAIRVSS